MSAPPAGGGAGAPRPTETPSLALEDLRRRVGDLSQVASTRSVRLGDGSEDGVRAVDVRVAGGLSALVLTDRGMDLGPAWAGGHQVSWQSTTGIVHPAHFDETAWLRSFHGGLLTTCGLQNVGPACEDQGVSHGLHGRISHIPARETTHGVRTLDGRLVAEVTGTVRETDVYGADLVLHRRLRFPVGEPIVEIHDEVENRGFEPAGLMLLYHVNAGYPVVADGSLLLAPDADVIPRDAPAAASLSEHARFGPPTAGAEALVYEHRLRGPWQDGWASVAVADPTFQPTGGIALSVRWRPEQLPRLWQWRMLAPGMYLTGLEPANCGVMGRAQERATGGLPTLQPGETRVFDVEVRVTLGPEVAAMTRRHGEGGAPA